MLRAMAEVVKRRRREPVDHPERLCANPDCREAFKPKRETQNFHSQECRKAHWAKAYHLTPHPCPYCTVIHDPEEKPVLDALEHLAQGAEDTIGVVQVWKLRLFIARRRAILRGEVGVATLRS